MAWTSWHPVILGFCGSLFTWGLTAAGAALVLFTTSIDPLVLDFSFGVAAGVMVAASCFGLLVPAMEMSEVDLGKSISWLPASIGFTLAFVFFHQFEVWLNKRVGSHEDIVVSMAKDAEAWSPRSDTEDIEENGAPPYSYQEESSNLRRRRGPGALQNNFVEGFASNIINEKPKNVKHSDWNRMILLISAITVHNFPEGMAVGVAFGAASRCLHSGDASLCAHTSSFGSAIALTIGIGLQNFPEGMAVALPLRKSGVSIGKSFWYGQLSGLVEPVGAILGAAATTVMRGLLPYSLGFAAGAMIYVVIAELIPETQAGTTNKAVVNYGFLAGFLLMMILDVALG